MDNTIDENKSQVDIIEDTSNEEALEEFKEKDKYGKVLTETEKQIREEIYK